MVREVTGKTPIHYGSATLLDVNTLPQFGDLPLLGSAGMV